MARWSIAAIAHLVFGRLAQAWHRARDPVRGPGDQSLGIHDRQAEQFYRPRGVGQPRRRLFSADDDGITLKQRAQLRREIADAENLMAADVDRRGRYLAMREAA